MPLHRHRSPSFRYANHNVAEFQSRELYDSLAGFPDGINSGIDATLLPKSQLSYAVNATMRGTFIGPRPEFVQRTLTFDDSTAQTAFEQGNWQGGCFYRPDTGNEELICSISGRIWSVDLVTLIASEITGTLTPNPSSNPIAWLWQTERWVIIQDGSSVAIIYDGLTCRRALGQDVLGTTTAGPFTIVSGGTQAVTLLADFLGTLGDSVIVNGTMLQTLAGSTSNSVRLTSIYDAAGTNYPAGTNVVSNPNRAGVMVVQKTVSVGGSGAPGSYNLQITMAGEFSGAVGNTLNIVGAVVTVFSISADRTVVTVTVPFYANSTNVVAPVGTVVTFNGSALPTPTAITLESTLPSLAIGDFADIDLTIPYTGVSNAYVWIGTKQYQIISLAPASNTTINLQNNTGSDITFSSAAVYSVPEIPIGRMGAYGMGRNWICLPDGISFVASDLVGGPSGSQRYDYRDSVLKMVENEFLAGGGSFKIPVSGDQITAMRFGANLDASLGQGPLQVFIRSGAFTCQTPVDRSTWTSLDNPILAQSLINNGALSQNATIVDNSDILFRSLDGARSFIMARRDFQDAGNTPISFEIVRLIGSDDVSLLQYGSAMVFDNRMLMTANPVDSGSGVYHTKLALKNNDPLSTLRIKLPPIWEGEWTGLNALQLIIASVGQVERGFALHKNLETGAIQLWEILKSADSRAGDVEWSYEGPAMFASNPNIRQYMCLKNGEVWVDRVSGALNFQTFYRADDSETWTAWREWTENANSGTFKPRMGLGQPEDVPCETDQDRLATNGYEFFFKMVVTGKCRIKGSRFMAVTQPEPKFKQPKCQ